MQVKYIKAVNSVQDLFHDLAQEGKLNDAQIKQFNDAQKVFVNFNQWVTQQISGNQKVELPWDSDEFKAKWLEWKKHHHQKTSKHYTSIGEQKALTHLCNISHEKEQKAILNIDYSMGNNWSGIYAQKEATAKANNKPGQILQSTNVKDYGNDWD